MIVEAHRGTRLLRLLQSISEILVTTLATCYAHSSQ